MQRGRAFRATALAITAACAAPVIAWLVVAPLAPTSQAIFGSLLVAAGFAASKLRSRYGALLVCILTFITSTRYMVWRFEGVAGFSSPGEWLLGSGLLLAETYTWVVMVLSFLQQARPLRRPIAVLGRVAENTPTVDVYVPTYNEPLSVVRPTVIAAMAMDYPRERFRVWLLDDGDRQEFAEFARQVGCGYLARTENVHAKAGNLNAAMKVTDGELICVLDCDHIPTRAFLQLTVGWFEKDPKLALVQTPHFFYSPDPIQRNVKGAENMPGEGELFYDNIQRGNDLWNATFFCGSCAVIRRAALEEVGGFAYETVTEDAHTALRIQRRSWNTAFLNMRLSAGLATETLGQHVAQRARWCRGMTQIMRIDNPLFGPGLNLFQRLCYLNALLYYQFPLVRIAFLTSPLAYLLFGLKLIHGSAAVVLVYAAPHLVQGLIANLRLQGKQRRLFWGEIFETILAFHLVRPAVLSFIWPKSGKFKVTDKGLRLETSFFDTALVRPHLITAALLVLGVVVGAARVLWFGASLPTLLLNVGWTSFNLLILLSAVAVARERRQVRAHVRRPARMPVTLYFADGRVVDAVTSNVSTGGLAIDPPKGFAAAGREVTHVDLQVAGGRAAFPVRGVAGPDGELRVQFVDLDETRERRLIQALLARADSWQPEPDRAKALPGRESVIALLRIASSTLRFVSRRAIRQARSGVGRSAAASLAVGAVVALGATSAPVRAAETPTMQRVIALDQLPVQARRASPECRADAVSARLELPSDQVVLSALARVDGPIAPLAGAELRVNGERAGLVSASGVIELEPAVFLPGTNAISLVLAPRASCLRAAAPLKGLQVALTLAPLTTATGPAPAVAPTRPVPAKPAQAGAAPGHARSPPRLLELPFAENPLALALAALVASCALSCVLSGVLDDQAQRRLGGMKETAT